MNILYGRIIFPSPSLSPSKNVALIPYALLVSSKFFRYREVCAITNLH